MNIFKNHWVRCCVLVIFGVLIGAYLGGTFFLTYANSKQIEYSQVLKNDYIDSRRMNIFTSMVTIAKAEEGNIDGILSNHETILMGSFLALIELYKSGGYKEKDEDIRKSLLEAREFIEARPELFVDQEYFAVLSTTDLTDTPVSTDVTNQMRKQLQNALDYVASLD